MRLDRYAGVSEVAQLDEVDDTPVQPLQLLLAVGRRPRVFDEVVRYPQPLLEVIGAPERDMPGVQRLEHRARVSACRGRFDSLGAELLAPLDRRLVVDLDRHPGEQARSKRRRPLQACRPFLQQAQHVLAGRQEADGEPCEAERSFREQPAVPHSPCFVGGSGEARPRISGPPRPKERVPSRQQQPRTGTCAGSGSCDGIERVREVSGRIFVRQL